MPHEPGHTNGNTIYKVYGTNEPYNGKVLKLGGEMYSTVGGALEGTSLQLVSTQINTDSDSIIEDTIDVISEEQSTNGNMNDMNQQNNPNPVSNESQDVVTIFVVTNNRQNEFYVEGFSNMSGGFYYDIRGNERDKVPTGTRLHHHTIPAQGDNNFMTQHSMDGGAVNVFTFNQTRQYNQDNMEMLPSAGTSGGGTTSGGMTSGGGSSGTILGGGGY